MNIIKESKINDYPEIISLESTEIIINQMKKKIFKIYLDNGTKGTGFFCRIPLINNKELKLLITNNHLINLEMERITISINNDKILKAIELNNRLKYTNREYDITIIEIKKEDNITDYLELDENIMKKEKNIYIKNSIYILQYPGGKKVGVSYGILKEIDKDQKYDFYHLCCTEGRASGSPIISLTNNKVIGIHKGAEKSINCNIGLFLNYAIEDFINKNKKYICENVNYNLNHNSPLNIIKISKIKEKANNNLNNERDNLMNEARKEKEQINELQNQLKKKDNIIKQKDNDIEKIQKDILELNKNLKNKENENITKYNNKLAQNKSKYEKYILQLQTEIEKYKNENKQIKKQNKDFILDAYCDCWKFNKEPILVGLNNIGATCYMNATLQCLSNTKVLTEYFLKTFNNEVNNKNKIMSNEYYNVVKNLWDRNNNNKSFSPYSFKEKLGQENPLFNGISANDSKDLINFLLERFHLELNEPKNNMMNDYEITLDDKFNEDKMLNIFINEFKMKYNSIISHLFYGILETKSQCQKCKNIKYNFQINSFLEFPLEQVNKYCFYQGKRQNSNLNNKNPDIDLYECFEYYQNMELMTGDNQMYCTVCKSFEDAFYRTQIYSAPNYLIINLNRGKGAVYECKVNFPEQLNLINFITFKNGNTVFELYAVICHLGPSSMSGYFVAFCKKKKDDHYRWYLFNDAIVSKCTSQEFRNGMPYILFYKNINM